MQAEHSGLRAIDFGLAEYCQQGEYLTDKVVPVLLQIVQSAASFAVFACVNSTAAYIRAMARHVEPEPFFELSLVNWSLQAGTVVYILLELSQNCCLLAMQAGTVIYISPEVLRGKYTLSADLWSAGVMAYQLLTGRLPFSGEDGDEVSELFMAKQVFENRVGVGALRFLLIHLVPLPVHPTRM